MAGPEQTTQPVVPPARMPDVTISLIRTWVPIAVGALVTWAAAASHLVIPAGASATAGALAAMLVAAGYYTLARLLERSTNNGVRTVGRYLLGGVVPPTYISTARATGILK